MTHVQLPPSGMIRSWVDTFEPLTEAPAEAQLAVIVAIISAGVGWKAPIKWGNSSEPCTISTILEGRSAMGRKTTTMNGGRAVVHEATSDIPDEHRGLFAHMLGHTSDVGLLELVAPKDDTTAQKWEDTPPPGHVLNWDEMGSILGDPGVTRKGGDWHGRTRTTMLTLANGRHSGIKTGAKKLPAARCAVSIVGTMTRVELEQRVDTGLLRDGFIGRFMLIPHNGRSRILSRPPAWTPAQVEQKNEIVKWVRMLSERREPFGDAYDLFTLDALAERDRWYEENTKRLDREYELEPSDVTKAAGEVFARLQTTQVKLAVVAAVSDMPTSQLLTGTPRVTLEHVRWSESVIETSFDEAVLLAAGGGRNEEDEYRDHATQWLFARGPTPRNEFTHRCTHKRLSATKRWQIAVSLADEGTLLITREKTSGRPRQIISVSPDYQPPVSPNGRTFDPYGQSPQENGGTPNADRKPENTTVSPTESRTENGSTKPLPLLIPLTEDTHIHRETPPKQADTDTPTTESTERVKSPQEPDPDPYVLRSQDDDIPF